MTQRKCPCPSSGVPSRNILMMNKLFQPVSQVILVAGAITFFIVCFGFKGVVEMEIGPRGGRLTIDSRQQMVDELKPPQSEVLGR